MGLFRAQAFEHWHQRRRVLPRTLPFSWDRATEKYVVLTASAPYDAYSFADDANSVAGNYIIFDRYTTPGGAEVFADGDGIPYTITPTTGRQLVHYREWRTAANAYVVVTGAGDGITAVYYINNVAPTAVGTIPNQQAYTNIAWEGPILDDYVTDAEGDAITWTANSGTLPTGITVQTVVLNVGLPNERTVQRLRGTPATGQQGTDTIVMRATDVALDFVNLAAFDIVTGVGQLMPDVLGDAQVAGLAEIALSLTSSTITIQLVLDALVTVGHIVETQPVAGTYVIPGSHALVTVSAIEIPEFLGIAGMQAVLEGLGFTVVVDEAESVYDVGEAIALTNGTDDLIPGELSLPGTVYLTLSTGIDSPDAFDFVDQTGTAKSAPITSASVAITGINIAAAITVSGGEYSVNGGAFTSSAGTLESGDTVRARHTSSALSGTSTTTTVTIGGVSATFTSTTSGSAPVIVAYTTVISGLSHLEGEEVVAWGGGMDLGTYTVSGGSITVTSTVVLSSVMVGLGYSARFKSSKLAYASDLGQPLGQRTRVDHVGFIMINTHAQGVKYGQDFDTLDDLPAFEDEQEVDPNHIWPEYDKDATEFNGGWSTDSRICLTAAAPRPATISALTMTLTKNDKA